LQDECLGIVRDDVSAGKTTLIHKGTSRMFMKFDNKPKPLRWITNSAGIPYGIMKPQPSSHWSMKERLIHQWKDWLLRYVGNDTYELIKKENYKFFFNLVRIFAILILFVFCIYLLSNLNYINIFIKN
jgi:hypothetical protein